MVAMIFSMQGVGQVVAPIVTMIVLACFKGAITDNVDNLDYVWRICIGLGAVPAVLTVYSRFNLPESPRYAANVQHDAIAAQTALDSFPSSKKKNKSRDEDANDTERIGSSTKVNNTNVFYDDIPLGTLSPPGESNNYLPHDQDTSDIEGASSSTKVNNSDTLYDDIQMNKLSPPDENSAVPHRNNGKLSPGEGGDTNSLTIESPQVSQHQRTSSISSAKTLATIDMQPVVLSDKKSQKQIRQENFQDFLMVHKYISLPNYSVLNDVLDNVVLNQYYYCFLPLCVVFSKMEKP